MKLFYIEDKYILIYRFVIIVVLTLTLLISILGGIFGITKWSGLLSGGGSKIRLLQSKNFFP